MIRTTSKLNTLKSYPIDEIGRDTVTEAWIINADSHVLTDNPDGDQLVIGGRIIPVKLAAPAAATCVTTGGASGNYTYVVVARLGSGAAPGAAKAITNGPTTLDAAHYNVLSWAAITGATSYDVYRTVGGVAQGKIASTTLLTITDNGLAGDSAVCPSINNTGMLAGAVARSIQICADNAAINTYGRVLITKGTAAALTLAAPVAGAPESGGDDGVVLQVTDTTGAAHTVTTPASKINGNKNIATFGGTANNSLEVVAYNGVWYVSALGGTTLSGS